MTKDSERGLRFHNITKDDMNNGKGLRVVLWLSGCEHHCKGCQNPQTWDLNSGIEFDKTAKAELFSALDKNWIQGLTLSGGDPYHEKNREGVRALLNEFRDRYGDTKDVWMYTGYKFDDIDSNMLELVDVIVDGEYIEELRDVSLEWRGSSNQKVYEKKWNKDYVWREM